MQRSNKYISHSITLKDGYEMAFEYSYKYKEMHSCDVTVIWDDSTMDYTTVHSTLYFIFEKARFHFEKNSNILYFAIILIRLQLLFRSLILFFNLI